MIYCGRRYSVTDWSTLYYMYTLKYISVRIAYINVQPHLVLLADVGDLVDGVEGPLDGCAGSAVDEEGNVTLGLAFDHQPLQFGGYHAAPSHNTVQCINVDR